MSDISKTLAKALRAERAAVSQAQSDIRSQNIDALTARFPQKRGWGFKLPGGTTLDPTSKPGIYEAQRTLRVEGLTLDRAEALDKALAAVLQQFEEGR